MAQIAGADQAGDPGAGGAGGSGQVSCTSGKPKIRFHDLRGLLTRIDLHADPKTLQQIADHASIETTMKYYVRTDIGGVAKALEAAFGDRVAQ